MAQAITSIPTAAAVTPATAVAPATTEVVADPSWGTIAEFIVGGTATTITIVRPGTFGSGDAVSDYVVGGGALTSTSRFVRLGAEYADAAATPTGAVTITFSQVTAVTWRIFRT
jgi:hypothetical protein